MGSLAKTPIGAREPPPSPPKSPAQSRSRRALGQVEVNVCLLPWLAAWPDSLSGVLDDAEESENGDRAWLRRFIHNESPTGANIDISLLTVWGEMSTDWKRVLTDDSVFDGSENYSSCNRYRVSDEDMRFVVGGLCADLETALRVEGQLVRLMTVSGSSQVRFRILKHWVVAVASIAGTRPLHEMRKVCTRLAELNTRMSICTRQRVDLMDGIKGQTALGLSLGGAWLTAFKLVEKVRFENFGYWAYDTDVCHVHGSFPCYRLDDELADEWDEVGSDIVASYHPSDDEGDSTAGNRLK